MSKNYGKALSAFRKINKIKSSSKKIDEARLKIFKQQQEAKQRAKELLYEKTMLSNLFDFGITAVGAAASESNIFDEGNLKKYAAGTSFLKDVILDAVYMGPENRDFLTAGLSSDEYINFKNKMSSQKSTLANAINQFIIFDQIEKEKKLDFFNDEFESMSDEEVYKKYGVSKDEMRNFMKQNIEYKKGKGHYIDRIKAMSDLLQKDFESNLISEEEMEEIKNKIQQIGNDGKYDFSAFRNYAIKRKTNLANSSNQSNSNN